MRTLDNELLDKLAKFSALSEALESERSLLEFYTSEFRYTEEQAADEIAQTIKAVILR